MLQRPRTSRFAHPWVAAAWRHAGAVLAVLCALLIIACWFLRTYFGAVSLDQLLYHLGQGGIEMADAKMLSRAARASAAALLASAVLVWLWRRLALRWQAPLMLGLLAGCGLSLASSLHLRCSPEGEDLLATAYVDPGLQTFVAAEPAPDLLLVFVESLEEAFVEDGVFGRSLAPQLARWRDTHGHFGRLRGLQGASWTMGGLFGALCGLPLQSLGLVTASSHEFATRFFAGGLCLTDLLAAQGWELDFYGGASLSFAGKGKFLATHGVQRRFGKEEWRARGLAVPRDGWGLLDASLTEAAWAQIARPHSPGRPRASIVLTVDTHGPNGYLDAGCQPPKLAAAEGRASAGAGSDADAEGEADAEPSDEAVMRESLRCADQSVRQLVERFLGQRDGRAKLVWVMGDHVSHPNPLTGRIEALRQGDRPIFHAWARYDADGRALPTPRGQREFTHLDVLPTLAEALGLRWQPQAHRLGLGVSLLAPGAQATQAERLGLPRLDRRLACTSPRFVQLWNRAPRSAWQETTAGQNPRWSWQEAGADPFATADRGAD